MQQHKEKCPAPTPPGGQIFRATGTIFELVQDIIGTNLLTMFHAIYGKMPRPLCGHVFPPTGTIFELIQDIIGTNRLTSVGRKNSPQGLIKLLVLNPALIPRPLFHKDRKINVASRVLTRKNAPPPRGHIFQPTGIIFELVQDIFGMNHLTKLNEDRTINVAPIVHVFQANATIFELIQDIIETIGQALNMPNRQNVIHSTKTNLLTKFHEGQ
ncbi:hypothetical protein DPMN_170306 [Dreissena polymorpha]|uniref:Uncharacterized protein n=1 Tax=Dreissena polymorpha TaxID=45954 RepID=A0A9D4DW35_DREPO|nr:hypothetical protein DPMN_170306 [Dreissena polymorpha]